MNRVGKRVRDIWTFANDVEAVLSSTGEALWQITSSHILLALPVALRRSLLPTVTLPCRSSLRCHLALSQFMLKPGWTILWAVIR